MDYAGIAKEHLSEAQIRQLLGTDPIDNRDLESADCDTTREGAARAKVRSALTGPGHVD